jgi:RNA polymerase sigma factor (sigma-70 family)
MDAAEQLYRDLIEPIEGRMVGVVLRIVRHADDADDALQDALARVWKLLPRIHRHPNPHGYILRICMSAAYDTLRARGRLAARESALDAAAEPADPPKQLDGLTAAEAQAALLDGLKSLPDAQRRAVLLRLVQEEPFETIALELGCTSATARSHYSKGRAQLRGLLSAPGEDEVSTG